MSQVDVQELTADERAEVEHELAVMRLAEGALMAVEPVSPEASIRRMETLGRLRLEITRVERLLEVVCPNCKGRSSAHWPGGPCTICGGDGRVSSKVASMVGASEGGEAA